MTRLLLMVMLLSACSSGVQRRELHDGPAVRPPPAFVAPGYAPAGAGLPEYMPTTEAPTVSRGTDRRVLPPTAEPGIWASDEPRAAVHPETGEPVPDDPVLLGVRLPFAPEAQTDAGKLPTRLCAFHMNLALGLSLRLAQANRLNDFEKACLAAKLYEHCARTNLSDYQARVKQTKRLDEVVLNRARNVDRVAKEFERKTCDGLPLLERTPNTISEIVRETVEVWSR